MQIPVVTTLLAALLGVGGAQPTVSSSGGLKAPAVGIVAGPDGAVWHTSASSSARVGRTTTAGNTTEWTLPDAKAKPGAITAGPGGALWFVQENGPVGRVTTAGVVSTVGDFGDIERTRSIAAGSDGNLWFTADKGDYAKSTGSGDGPVIGRLTPSGTMTLFGKALSAKAKDITAGPDGALWFTEPEGDRIGRITPAGEISEFSVGITADAEPTAITAGPDGALWFTEAHGIGRITPSGAVSEFTSGLPTDAVPGEITAGPDGALWFTLKTGVGRISTGGTITAYETVGMEPRAITAGSDGAIWFADAKHAALGRIEIPEPTTDPTPTPTASPTAQPTPTGPSAAPPKLGQSVVVGTKHGVVRIKTPGRGHFRKVAGATNIPVGSLVDTRNGKVALKSAINRKGKSQTGIFHGGLFKVRQTAGGQTQILLRGRLDCRAKTSLATTSRKKKRKRRVWGKDSGGSYSTHGRDSVATVRGTRWLTEDRCGGTLTKVVEGVVAVRDRATGKRVVLHAGERHFARHKR